MTYKIVIPKSFNNELRKLNSQGNKKIVQAVRAAMTEAGTNGEIKSLPRTKHGESRIPNVEKYDLPEAYRLVVQLVDGVLKTRAFLFLGNHDEAEHWLDTHKNYKWVKNESDGVLNFVLVTIPAENRHVPADRLNLESSDEWLQKPILHMLTESDWQKLGLDETTKKIIISVSGSDFEQDADGILEKLTDASGYETASLLFDLMWHSHAQEWQEMQQRLQLLGGEANVLDPSDVAVSMSSLANSESFITFDDKNLLSDFFSSNTLADWMLFVHPEQKIVAEREFRGPARLRGVSGSGKTCVLVHRARNLAKKYSQPVLLVTLTESMRKLLERLIDDLCGVERSLISTKTMSMLAKDTLAELVENRSSVPFYLPQDRIDEIIRSAESFVRRHSDIERSVFNTMTFSQLSSFLQSEISYVRGRLNEASTDKYMDSKYFQRRGRGTPLGQTDRKIVLDAINYYVQALHQANSQDHEGFVSMAIEEVSKPEGNNGRFRCILSDEVQDLSELDISLMGKLKTPAGDLISKVEDGLFLAGDGAQSIYKRGFALRRVGIDIIGRSFSLKKNYRNTHEILRAAFGLVSQYEFADVDEENISRPSMPDFAKRYGSKPLLVRCSGIEDEATVIAKDIYSSLAMGQSPGQICVIGPNVKARHEIEAALNELKINSVELRNDVDYESENVKVSTIESAKGHEFSSVYIMSLVEGVLPALGIEDDGVPREASRLYVAMTRAREKLTITYSPKPSSPASRFLTAIQNDCTEAHSRNGELRMIA
jgi:superfamily I DNA/RNA helicase